MDLIDRLHRQVHRSPGAVAVVDRGTQTSYRELDERANRLAHRLIEGGVGPEVVVGMCLPRGLEAITGMLAIMKAGGVYLPLDPAYPHARLSYLVRASQARLVLGGPGFGVPGVMPGTDVDALPATPPDRPRVGDSLMCVIFTSGSTGQPKGIGLPSRTIENVADWALRVPAPRICAQFCSLGFDMSLQEVFGTLLGGGTLVVVGEEQRKDPFLLLELLERERVERLYLSPGFLRRLAAAYLSLSPRPRLALREIIAAGEVLRVTNEVRRFLAGTGAVLENQYGPSETHQATANPLRGAPDEWPASPAVGTPVPHVAVHVLDERLDPAESGEIYIGGRGVARGYLGQPALTAERFLPDPFAGRPGAVMYRTGDLGRRTPDGIEFLGRVDDQVKVRGFRVEPSEVESAILAHPDVREAAVVARRDGDGDWRLDAYAAGPADAAALRAFLEQRLPGHVMPATVQILDRLPLNHNGKVDRAALPEPSDRPAGTPYAAPENEQEAVLCGIFAEVLGIARVGVHDDFGELGGNSLAAAKIATRIVRDFGVQLPVRTVFQRPTVRGLARAVEEALIAEIRTLSPTETDAAVTSWKES